LHEPHPTAWLDGQQRLHRTLDREVRGGFIGGRIHIAGLNATNTDVLVRLERLDGTAQVTRLTPSVPSLVVEAAPGVVEVARTYVVLGVEHILTGIDHLLFVLALLIITRGGWKLLKTVSAFTLSHSITLSAATLGFVHVPQRPVEAVIALSIVFVAVEIVRVPSRTRKHHRARPVARGSYLRADARPGLRWWFKRSRLAAGTYSDSVVVFQRWV
jgi:hypothetical protein